MMRTYQVQIEDQPFVNESLTTEKTAVVKTILNQKVISIDKYGVVDVNEIYQKIINQQPVDLSFAYVQYFSIQELKRLNNLQENEEVSILKFKAKNAFFDTDKLIDFSRARFLGGADFSDSIFSNGELSFLSSKFEDGNVKFKQTYFDCSIVNFQYAKFGKGEVNFTNAIFNGEQISFINTSFGDGNVSFKNVDFNQSKPIFHFSKFGEGDKSFENAIFGDQGCDVRKVEFGSGKIDFRKAVFGNGDVVFDESEIISGKLIFRLATFGTGAKSFKSVDFGKTDVLFENVNFGSGTVSFAQCKAQNISFKGSHLNVYLDLKINECDSVDLTDTVIRDIIDLKPSTSPVKIAKLYLVGARNLGRIIVDWELNDIKNWIKNQSDSTLLQKAEQFNIFKENFHLNGQYEDEDKAYVQFKRFEYRAEVNHVKTKGGKEYLKAPFLFFRWLVFDKMGLFATSPLRVLFSMLLVYVCFSLLYLLIGFFHAGDIVNAVGATDHLSFFQTCFYHSAITFLTIGYGDYYPMGFERVISIIEGWSGVFLMSYFTVAFVRKILR